jgi:hypothetical protein
VIIIGDVFSIGCTVHPSPRSHRSSDAKPEWETVYFDRSESIILIGGDNPMPDVKNTLNSFHYFAIFIIYDYSLLFFSKVRFTVWSVSAIWMILASVHLSSRFEKGIGDQEGLDSVQAVVAAFKRIWSDSIPSPLTHCSSDPIWTRTCSAKGNSQAFFRSVEKFFHGHVRINSYHNAFDENL